MCAFDDDAWRLAKEASRCKTNQESQLAVQRDSCESKLNGFRGLGRERGNRCHQEDILRVILWDFLRCRSCTNARKKSVSGHMVQENARDPWGSQFEAQEKLTRPGMTQMSDTQASRRPYSHCLASALHCCTGVDENAVPDRKNVYRWWKHVSCAARRHGGSFFY